MFVSKSYLFNMKKGVILLVLTGIILIPIGAVLLLLSELVKEISIDYTFCKNDDNKTCSDIIEAATDNSVTCHCNIDFNINENIPGPVYVYYGLNRVFTNHRLFLKSRDYYQLGGDLMERVSSDCFPLDYDPDGKPYLPCGSVANAMFSDSFTLISYDYGPVPVHKTGLVRDVYKEYLYENPENPNLFDLFVKPKNWTKQIWELDPDDSDNNGLVNEDFMNWMNGAALPWFRKLYRRIDHNDSHLNRGLPKGHYYFKIEYRYNTVKFNGTKMVVIANTGFLGAKNPFLGILYITGGIILTYIASIDWNHKEFHGMDPKRLCYRSYSSNYDRMKCGGLPETSFEQVNFVHPKKYILF